MGTYLYGRTETGGIEVQIFPAERVQAHLDGGWVADLKDLAEPLTEKEADTNNTGKLSPKEIRAAARKAGVKDWGTARIKKLKEALGYES